MSQDIVIVRDFQGIPLVRHIWGIGAKVIYVTNDSADPATVPIGFPKKDVFRYDSKCLEMLNNIPTISVRWEKLAIYCANNDKEVA